MTVYRVKMRPEGHPTFPWIDHFGNRVMRFYERNVTLESPSVEGARSAAEEQARAIVAQTEENRQKIKDQCAEEGIDPTPFLPPRETLYHVVDVSEES